MDGELMFSAVPVRGFAESVDWYTRLFGRPADVLVHEREVMWRVVDVAWLYVLEDAERSGGTVVTISVADLDATLTELTGRGIGAAHVELVGDAGRKAMLSDPDGNTIALLELA